MRFNTFKIFILFLFLVTTTLAFAWDGMPMPKLRVEGRYLKDSHGHIINLHGFVQTYSPWFNEQNSKWNNFFVIDTVFLSNSNEYDFPVILAIENNIRWECSNQ